MPSQTLRDLKRQEKLLQTVFDPIPIMLNLVDRTGRVRWVNSEWQRVLGWSLQEVRTLDVLHSLPATPPGWHEFRTRRKDGQWIDTAWAHVRFADGTTIGIGQDTTERKQVERQLRASHEQLRRLSARAAQAIEGERADLARELHDQLGQLLTALKMELTWVSRQLPPDFDAGGVRDRIQTIGLSLDACVQKVRLISTGLRPGALDRLGLIEAIEWQAGEFERHSGVRCRFQSSIETLAIDVARATQVFRILQEALTNATRHADATRVTITVGKVDGRFQLEIRDNGRGISDKAMADPGSLGLLGMHERALLAGGTLGVARAGKKGTIVTVTLPIDSGGASRNKLRRTPKAGAHPHFTMLFAERGKRGQTRSGRS